jgi:ribonuclease D
MEQAPKSVDELTRLRTIHDRIARSARARDQVDAVRSRLARRQEELPPLPINESLPPSANEVADLLRVLQKAVVARYDVAAKLIATSEDLDKIALDDEAEVAALHGWRRELFGEDALAIKAGRLALTVEGGRIVTLPRQTRPATGEAADSAETSSADEMDAFGHEDAPAHSSLAD